MKQSKNLFNALIGISFSILLTAWSQFGLLADQAVFDLPANTRPLRQHDPARTESLTVVLRPDGFPPGVLQIPSGRYALNFHNRSGIADVRFVFERISSAADEKPGTAIREEALASRLTRTTNFLQLTPGAYRLRVLERPKWNFTVEVK